MGIACGIGRVVHTEREVESAQRITRNAVDLGVKERAERRVHREGTNIAIGQIHAGGEHRDGQLATLLDTHGLQLAVQLHVFRCIKREFQPHIVERTGNHDTAVELDTAPCPTRAGHSGLGALGGGDVQRGIHRLTGELDI